MASTNYQSKAIAAARGEVGYRRKSSRWNKYADEVYPTVQHGAYCGVFVTWAYHKAGVDLRKWCWMPYVPFIYAAAKKIGAWKTSGPKDGDLVLYNWGETGRYRHVGIVWRDPNSSGYRAVEGNTSSTSAGSQGNGGAVAVRYRGRQSIAGWVDMEKVLRHLGVQNAAEIVKDAAEKASGAIDVDSRMGRDTVQEMQERLKNINSKLSVDGRAGEATWKVLQAALGTYVDGVVDHQSYKGSELGNGIVDGKHWDYDGRGAKGSNMVKALQKAIGLTGKSVDGIWGESTTKALQVKLNEDQTFLTKKV